MSEMTKITQCFLPPLVAGKYTVEVGQTISNKDGAVLKEGEIGKSFEFGVDAARFRLNPADIYSVYPPANQYGKFSGFLPHVVFTRRTLPWERTIDGKLPKYLKDDTPKGQDNPQDNPPVPWMALILFNEDEMKDLKIVSDKVSSVIFTGNNDGIVRPEIFEKDKTDKNADNDKLELMEWENGEDGCFTIDITKEQFEEHLPSMESLTYLAHAKEVRIDYKDKDGITDLTEKGAGVFSVIIGNTIPTEGKAHTALLVSLEGFWNYLVPAKGQAPLKVIPQKHKVRLVVLANWAFTNSGDATFYQLVKGLEIKSMGIKKGVEKAKALSPYFNKGYVPLEHLTRTGATTVSWYHGPFLPMMSPKMSYNISFSSADQALRYDKATGMFDISFAAAWQLGRVLALQNQAFSKAILSWRIQQKQKKAGDERKNKVTDIINATNDGSDLTLKNKVVKYLADLNKVSTGPLENNVSTVKDEETPAAVKNFLALLYRLNGVPFSYLVPHESFLEKQHDDTKVTGTLALFYVDPNWIEALMDGALSIGRVQNTDSLLSDAMKGSYIPDFSVALSDGSIPAIDLNTKPTNIPTKQLNITGFLLRSDIISGWRGVEIQAFNKKDGGENDRLTALRLERIDQDIFLGIFRGNVKSIVITQPYEGMHFGFKINDENNYEKSLKNEIGKNDLTHDGTGDVDSDLKKIINEKNIVDIAGLAALMKGKLISKGWMNTEGASAGKYFTSAEFAYQMVDSPVQRTINIDLIT